jgi:hypothetical protein
MRDHLVHDCGNVNLVILGEVMDDHLPVPVAASDRVLAG